jgi:cytochrome P450
LYYLSQHPEVCDRLAEEHRALPSGPVLPETVKNMFYTDHVLREVMRKEPPVPLVGRQTMVPAQLGGFALKPKTVVLIPIRLVHHHPSAWDEPERFNPDRFEKNPVLGSYLPFLLGPHVCLGLNFAMYEMKVVLHMLVRRGCRFVLAQSAPRVRSGMFHKPDKLWMRVRQLPRR